MKNHFLLKRILCFCMALIFLFCVPVTRDLLSPSTTVFASSETNKISLNLKSKELVKNTTFCLNVYRTSSGQTVTFKSSNKNVASIGKTATKSALIQGNKVGTAIITVKVKQSLKTVATLTCKIVVTPPAISIKLPFSTISLTPKDKYLLNDDIIIKPNTTSEMPTYQSSDPTVASISTSGIITAHSKGTTTIKATLSNGKSDTCKVVVSK